MSDVFLVSASDKVSTPVNAGIKATGRVTVSFYTMSPGKTIVGSPGAIDVPVNEAIAAITGNVKAGSGAGEFPLPANTHLAAGETNPQPYVITWDSATDIVEFEVEYDSYSVSYSYTGTAPAGAPALPSAQTYACYDSVNVAAAPTLAGYDFSGWTPTTTSGITVSGTPGSFTMPGNAVVFEGSWSEQEYTIHYHANGGTGSATSWTGKIGGTVMLPIEEFTRDDYDFLGFDHTNTAEEATYCVTSLTLDEPLIGVLFAGGSKEATLYAIWGEYGSFLGIWTPPPPNTNAYPSSTIQAQVSNPGSTGNTGDTSDILGWTLALFLSWLGILSILLWRIRRPVKTKN